MEASVRKDGNSLDGIYTQDRPSHSQTKMYTPASKEIFLLAQVFPGDDRLPRRHRITQAPDFDHIVAVKIEAPGFTEAELSRGVMVMIPDRENSAAQRLKANEIVAAQGAVRLLTSEAVRRGDVFEAT